MDPKLLRYTEEHEWIGEGGGIYVLGITEYAQDQLGDITYVELPEIGRRVAQGEEAAVVESVKAASDIYAPVDGTVAEVNESLESAPEKINQDPYGEGWLFKLKEADAAQFEGLMDAAAYEAFLENQDD
jgi:glycine cleavage system H protein